MNESLTRRFAVSTAVLAAMLSMAACQRADERTVGQKVDDAVATTEQKAAEVRADAKDTTAEMRADAKSATAEIKADAKNAADEMKQAANEATDKVGDKVKDAAITTAINAELARDPKLSALRINVDTQAGKVALNGTAPDAASRDRATQLAQSVDGVTTVENRLVVRGS